MTLKQEYVDRYLQLYHSKQIVLNKDRKKLISLVEDVIMKDDSLYFDDRQIKQCVKFIEKWYFPTKPFQRFIIAFFFLKHKETELLYYNAYLLLIGRGGGKNGLISGMANYFISELHGIPGYNVSVVANSEEQAMTSITEVYNTVSSEKTLQKAFKAGVSQIKSKQTNSIFKFRTSNGNTKDGLRDGCVIFDEIHQYADNSNVKVHISGLGKVRDPREIYIGSDGYIRDGFLDKKLEMARKVLDRKAPADLIFPFICKLDKREEVDDQKKWEKANPMLSKPVKGYALTLLSEVQREYNGLVFEPSGTEEFMTKRMDMPSSGEENAVAPYEEIKKTAVPIDYEMIKGRECIGAVDFASIRDFTGCVLTFRHDGKYISLKHSFARKAFADKYYGYSRTDDKFKKIAPPIAKWEGMGLLTVVDEPTIDPQMIVDWFTEQSKLYNIKEVVIDNFRADLLRRFFEEAGFEVEVIHNPTAISALLAPRVEDGFANHKFIWGDDPLMRWYTNNVYVTIDKKGNKNFSKKDERRRKTDGFMAFVYSLYRADDLDDYDIGSALDTIAGLNF